MKILKNFSSIFISDCKDTTFFSIFHGPFWSFFILHLQITTIFRIFAVFFSPLRSNRHIQKKRTTVCYPVIEVVGYLTLTDNQHSCPCCIFYAYTLIRGTQKIHTDICCDLYLIRVSKLPTFQWLRQTSVSKRYISICHIYPLQANSPGQLILRYKVTTFFSNMQIFGADFCREE